MKYRIDYQVVIPVFDEFDNLDTLLGHIAKTNIDYQPQSIIIIDDGSTDDRIQYADGLLGGQGLPPIKVYRKAHEGPYSAETFGLEKVITPYALVMHSDVQLMGNGPPVELHKDPLSLLICYLAQTNDAVAVSCYGLNINDTDFIVKGNRVLDTKGIPYCPFVGTFFYSQYRISLFRWHRVISLDSHCYALNMEIYKQLDGFSEDFAPYGFYHDDFFARARQNKKHSYMTQEAAVYHPLVVTDIWGATNKPEGSMAVLEGKELITKFQLRWGTHTILHEQSLLNNPLSVEEIGR
tara:strand:- start:744 stop:1625 length:882 start_codon:yes stop_codon:yes gene_type:complete